MTALDFAIASLACFRLTRLFTDDKIMDWFRRGAVREAPQAAKKRVKEGVNCPFCVSFYFAVPIAVSLWALGLLPRNQIALVACAIWGASILLNQLFTKLSK